MSEVSREQALAHFGVKGMKWGVRRSDPTSSKQRELKKIERKIDRGSEARGRRQFAGAELVGYGIKKEYAKRTKQDPNFHAGKLSPSDRAAYLKAGKRRTLRRMALMTALDMAAFGIAPQLVVSKMRLNPQTQTGARVSFALLAGQVGKTHISEFRAVRAHTKGESQRARRDQLRKELGRKPV